MKRFYVVLSISLALAGFRSVAKADAWDKRTVVTFRSPVEIPGRVLAAGTYVMKLADSDSDRNVVEFFDKNETHLDAMVMAIPAYRMNPPDTTVITFEERAANAPQAIKYWFSPGDNTGEEFIYKKAAYLGTNPPPPATFPQRSSPSASSVAPKPVQAAAAPAPVPQKPQPVEIAQAKPAPAAPAQPSTAPANSQPQKELPKTASDLPLVALLGGVSLLTGAFLRRIA